MPQPSASGRWWLAADARGISTQPESSSSTTPGRTDFLLGFDPEQLDRRGHPSRQCKDIPAARPTGEPSRGRPCLRRKMLAFVVVRVRFAPEREASARQRGPDVVPREHRGPSCLALLPQARRHLEPERREKAAEKEYAARPQHRGDAFDHEVELWRATKLRNHVREDHQRICQKGPLILAVHALCAPERETLAHDGHTQRLNRASLEA